jgi:hypothetical protein
MQKTIDDFYKDAERLSLLLKDLSATSHNLFTTIDALKEGGVVGIGFGKKFLILSKQYKI